MKIDMIDIIKEALVGGRNGEMEFIYNNHFIADIFLRQGVDFKTFLKNILDETNSDKSIVNSEQKVRIYDVAMDVDEEYISLMKEKRELNERINKKSKDIIRKKSNSPLVELFDFNGGERIFYDVNKNSFYGYINSLKIIEGPMI